MNYAYYDSPFGPIQIGYDDAVRSIRHVDKMGNDHMPAPLSDRAAGQLEEYFKGIRREFDLPLAPAGTPFQMAVWEALREIPYGETRSYGQIAAAIGKPKASRAVGMACNRNPIWIVIPCHRVVGSTGKLTGYEGGLDMKHFLLELENR
ncbi:MAG: methylated-DNA--[Oscillospiraceae bacterium]|nr:methylated-DNA--[protein]-cysteine S-methyltransferase [Oscillospiraceae bacterium]